MKEWTDVLFEFDPRPNDSYDKRIFERCNWIRETIGSPTPYSWHLRSDWKGIKFRRSEDALAYKLRFRE